MVGNLKENFKDYFSNGPKAKITMGVAVSAIVLSVTFANTRKTVNLVMDGKEQSFVTYKGTVKDILEANGIVLSPKDKVLPSLDTKVTENDVITIKRAVSVDIKVGGQQIKIDTAEETIGDMLKSETEFLKAKGLEYIDGVDEVYPSLDTKVSTGLEVKIVQVDVKEEVVKEDIDFEIIEETDDTKSTSYEEVTQQGQTGAKEVTYKVVYKDGKEVSRKAVKNSVVKEPVNEIVVVGTKASVATRDGNMEYKSLLYCESTAYTGGGTTATGTTPVRVADGYSTIAVDPTVIPLGTLVYVEGYGYAVAEDTGGAIKGNIIDVYVNTYEEGINWGRKHNVPVYIIAYAGEF